MVNSWVRQTDRPGITRSQGIVFLRNDFSFRRFAVREIMKYSRRPMVRAEGELASGLALEADEKSLTEHVFDEIERMVDKRGG
jgi:hypothetical protein